MGTLEGTMCRFILHLTQKACLTRMLEQYVAVRKQKIVVKISKMISELPFARRQLQVSVPGGKKWPKTQWISRGDALPTYPPFSNQLSIMLCHLRPAWLPQKTESFMFQLPAVSLWSGTSLRGKGMWQDQRENQPPGLLWAGS